MRDDRKFFLPQIAINRNFSRTQVADWCPKKDIIFAVCARVVQEEVRPIPIFSTNILWVARATVNHHPDPGFYTIVHPSGTKNRLADAGIGAVGTDNKIGPYLL